MNNDLETYHSLLEKIEVLTKKLKSERAQKSKYKARWLKLKGKAKSTRSFGAQVALNLIHRRATTNPELTLVDIAEQAGVEYSYVKTLNRRYNNGNIN